MAVFRIDKTRDYTVMSNHHLRNTGLSLKAKGLLSLMLSAGGMGLHHKGLAHIARMAWTVYAPECVSWRNTGM